MASVRFEPVPPGPDGKPRFKASFNKTGSDLPRKSLLKAAEMLKLHPGDRYFHPRGVDIVR
jgi:hypothetical protein